MVAEVLACLRPSPGEIAVDCTLGGGGHAREILPRLLPGGRLIGIDVDAAEMARTVARLRDEGFGADVVAARHASFADLPHILTLEGIEAADIVLVDLGVSSMQRDTPERGFNYKLPGPLDMRMDPSRGEPASRLLATASELDLARILTDYSDEPHAAVIAELLARQPVETTHALERLVRTGLNDARPHLTKSEVKASVRRTFQAIRIAVNDELAALDRLLEHLPFALSPGGRAALLTFHSGEDRRVKKALQAGLRAGVFSSIAKRVVRSKKSETWSNRRAAAAKLRWAVRAGAA